MRDKGKAIGKTLGAILLVLVVILTGINMNPSKVYAGSGEQIIKIDANTTELESGSWSIPNDDLTIETGKLVFSKESSSDTRVITRLPIKKVTDLDELFSMSFHINLKDIPEGERFIIALAVDTIESYSEEAGSLEIYIENGNGLHAGVCSYDETGEAQEVVAGKSVGATKGSDIAVEIKATTAGNLSVTIGGKSIINQQSPIDMEGRLMLTQTGGCEVEISNFHLISYTYDRPENSNFTEDFETGKLNTAVLDAKMGFGAGHNYYARMQVEEYNGNHVLMFHNARQLYFGTAQEYSNFELTFDMPYYLHKDILREDGTIKTRGTMSMVLAIGCPPGAEEWYVYQQSADSIVIEGNSIYNLYTQPTYRKYFDETVYSDPENNVGYSLKIRLVDTILSVYFKSRITGEWDEMISYKIADTTPLGRFYVSTGGTLELAIDNFSITNLDKDGNVVEAGYSTYNPPAEDWVYEEYDAPYLTVDAAKVQEAPDWLWIVGAIVAAGVLVFVTATIIVIVRKIPKKKGAKANEI